VSPVASPSPEPAPAPMRRKHSAHQVDVKMASRFSADFFRDTTKRQLECHIAQLASVSTFVSCDDVQLTIAAEDAATVELSLANDELAAASMAAAAEGKPESVSVTLNFAISVQSSESSSEVARAVGSTLRSAHAATAELHVNVSSVPLVVETGQLLNVVIISDRLEPLAAAIGSIVLNTNSRLHVHIIAHSEDGLQERLTKSIPLKPGQVVEVRSMANVTSSLLAVGIEPIWTWAAYGESMGPDEKSWRTNATLQQEMWDHDPMHASPFNHLRFYLPHLPYLADLDNLIFLDDDVVVQKDIAQLAVELPKGKVIAAPCDTWVWGDGCSHFDFVSAAKDWRKNSAVLYLNPAWRSCGSAEECGLAEYEATIQSMAMKIHGKKIAFDEQPVWNFGAVLVDSAEWRRQNMTKMYHAWLRENYRAHVWREDSLAYGLGIPYLAFAGKIACWNELLPELAFRDGLGYVSAADLAANHLDIKTYLSAPIVLHWSGRRKPWTSERALESAFRKPWENLVQKFGLRTFAQPEVKSTRKKAIFFTEPRSGSEWFMDLIDHHPQICATGDRHNPTAGFAREALIPEHYSGSGCGFRFPTCSLRLSCSWAFFAKWVPHYHSNYANWCESGNGIIDEDVHATHGSRLCEAARVLSTKCAVARLERPRLCVARSTPQLTDPPVIPLQVSERRAPLRLGGRSNDLGHLRGTRLPGRFDNRAVLMPRPGGADVQGDARVVWRLSGRAQGVPGLVLVLWQLRLQDRAVRSGSGRTKDRLVAILRGGVCSRGHTCPVHRHVLQR
jgi:lipopolysaccharide biosynthesis glycosyltransferase